MISFLFLHEKICLNLFKLSFLSQSLENKSLKIVTTEKDYYRMTEKQQAMCEYVKVNLEIENEKEFKNLIKSYLWKL